jgi:hypothetical protein
MKIGIPHPELDRLIWLQIEEASSRIDKPGYRVGQKWLLRSDVFHEFWYAHQNSDFPAMKKILESVQELDWKALPWEPINHDPLQLCSGSNPEG